MLAVTCSPTYVWTKLDIECTSVGHIHAHPIISSLTPFLPLPPSLHPPSPFLLSSFLLSLIPPFPFLTLDPSLSFLPPLELSQECGLTCDDIISTLQYYSLLKYWKGKHIIIKRKVIT